MPSSPVELYRIQTLWKRRRRGQTRRQKCYSVYNPTTHRVFSKCTTKDKALRQKRILELFAQDKLRVWKQTQ